MAIFTTEFINTLKQNNNIAQRVKINHHVRNLNFEKFLNEEVMKAIKDCDDEYSFRCQNILMKNTDFFVPNALDYLENQETLATIDIKICELEDLFYETNVELYDFM